MPHPRPDAEDTLERATIDLFTSLGWTATNAFDEDHDLLGRNTRMEVVLVRELRTALEKLNPELPTDAIDQAIETLTRDRSVQGIVQANREIAGLLKEGIKVTYIDPSGEQT